MVFADRPYSYQVTGQMPGADPQDDFLSVREVTQACGITTLCGHFPQLNLVLTQTIRVYQDGLQETLTLHNLNQVPLQLHKLNLGFSASLTERFDWRLCAIPFRVQLDGSHHDYTVPDLIAGRFHNTNFSDTYRVEIPIVDHGVLRSEAWAWGVADQGLLVVKYNNTAIEYSMAEPYQVGNEWRLRFGGIGFALYGEPSQARTLAPNTAFTFGSTCYFPYSGSSNQAFYRYRAFLDEQGHGFPPDYNPPVNWNELYDVGWYHSNPAQLHQFYTRPAMLIEAEKAQAVGCELLYLDPGWEVAEGETLWDESRLGAVDDFILTLKRDYNLDLAYRTILRTYLEHWPAGWLVKHPDRPQGQIEYGQNFPGYEPCLCNPVFWQEKLTRILDISRHGVRFMMFDEMDWRGSCYDLTHGHPVPTTPYDHVQAVYRLTRAVRQVCPGLTVEAHDPIWPWLISRYLPTYFQQGFGENGFYDENWGFEYMWDCLNDLRSGRALALYSYALGCNVPLYLHITMAADNDACVFFWWVASTVRHLGIGGKTSNKTIEPGGGLPSYDTERRFAAYTAQMRRYQSLKPYFVRGQFYGLAENIHLHTLPGVAGGVILFFNLTEEEQTINTTVSYNLLQTDHPLPVSGADFSYTQDALNLQATLPPMSPRLIVISNLG